MYCAGIDAGSRAIKILLMDTDSLEIIASGVVDQGKEHDALSRELFERILKDNGLKRNDISRIVATGYARNNISITDTTITEITCHARGVCHLVPDARTVIEIGGQDSKVLRLDGQGAVRDFAMNDRCAAGTGRFLEVVAAHLGVELQELGEMRSRSLKPAAISSMCVVFAETEIFGLLASGTAAEDIVAGIQAAVAARVRALVGRNITAPIIFTGGVAMVSGMANALESVFGEPVSTAPDPQMTGALGAAILACRQRRHGVDTL